MGLPIPAGLAGAIPQKPTDDQVKDALAKDTFPIELRKVTLVGKHRNGEEVTQTIEIRVPKAPGINEDFIIHKLLKEIDGFNIKTGDDYTYYPFIAFDSIKFSFSRLIGVSV